MNPEEIEELKEELKRDLSQGYYKISQAKLITLIGCTVSVCLSMFGGALYIDRSLNKNSSQLEQHSKDISQLQVVDKDLYGNDKELNTKIEKLESRFIDYNLTHR